MTYEEMMLNEPDVNVGVFYYLRQGYLTMFESYVGYIILGLVLSALFLLVGMFIRKKQVDVRDFIFYVYITPIITILGTLLILFVNGVDYWERSFGKWEEEYVREYLKDMKVEKSEEIKKISIGKRGKAEVYFIVAGELRTEKVDTIKVRKEVKDVYVEYKEIEGDFEVRNKTEVKEEYKKGDLVELVLYLPKDYEIQ